MVIGYLLPWKQWELVSLFTRTPRQTERRPDHPNPVWWLICRFSDKVVHDLSGVPAQGQIKMLLPSERGFLEYFTYFYKYSRSNLRKRVFGLRQSHNRIKEQDFDEFNNLLQRQYVRLRRGSGQRKSKS